MTFLLNQQPPPQMQARGFGQELPTFWQGLGAGARAAQISTNANFEAARADEAVLSDYARRIYDGMGRDQAISYLNERGFALDPNAPNTDSIVYDRRAQQELLNRARENPDTWGFDVTEQGIKAEQDRRLQVEFQNAQDMLALLPQGQRTAAELVGSMAGMTADIRNIPFLLAGGGSGRFLTVVGREAALNTMAEAATMPGSFTMAERLGIADPDVAQQLAIAAAAGGVLGGIVEAGSRGLTYFFGTRRVPSQVARPEWSQQILVDEAEAAIAEARPNPFEEVMAAVEADPVMPPREPLIPPQEPPVEQRVDTPSVMAAEVEGQDIRAQAEAAASQEVERALAEYPWLNRPYPLAREIARKGGIATRNADGTPSFAYSELKARGVDTRRIPWLFNNKKGSRDLDNLDFEPEVMDWIGRSDDGLYVNRERVLDLIAEEMGGNPSALTAQAEAALRGAESAVRQAGRTDSPVDDFLTGQASRSGMYVDREMYDFAHEGNATRAIGEDVNRWLDDNGYTDLSPELRAEIVNEAQTRGGDVEFLVERAIERDLADAEQWFKTRNSHRQGQGPARAGDGTDGAIRAGDAADGGGRAAGEDGGGAPRQSEQTAAGEQTLIDGVAPVTDADRLRARQEARLTGRMRELDDGLFDLSAREQMDWLDQPAGTKSQPIRDQQTADLRDAVAAGDDPLIELEDGRSMRLSEALDDLDRGDEFAEVIALCGRRPTT